MIRVLTVLNWLNRGGAEVQLLQALPSLRQLGVETDICCMGPGVLDADFVKHGCSIWRVPKTPNCLATANRVDQILSSKHYDVLHTHLGYTSGGFVLGGARATVPIAVSYHGPEEHAISRWRRSPVLRPLRRAMLQWHRRLICRYAHLHVGHSEANLDALNTRWRDDPIKHRVVLNGVEFPAELPSRSASRRSLGVDEKTLLLLHVGSFKPEKNHSGLLQIFRNVVDRRPQAMLLLVGDGRLRPAIEAECRRLSLDGRVILAGLQSNVWPYYAAADIFVFPSTYEGFGNVLVEAQAAGVPVVASDIPPHHESVAPIRRKWLFPLPRYDQAAQMVLEHAETKANGQSDSRAAQQYVRQQFSIERFSADLRQLYCDLTTH